MSFSPRKKKKSAVPIDQGTGAHVGSTFDRLDGRITIKANLVSKDMSVGNSVTAKIVTGNSPGERFSEKDVRIAAAPTESMIKHFQKMEDDIVMGAERLLAKTKSKKPKTTTSKNDGPGLCATSMRETNLSDSELEALVECVPGLLSVRAPDHWNAKVAVASTDQQDGLYKPAVAGVNKLSDMGLQKGVAQIEIYLTIRGEQRSVSLTPRIVSFMPLKKSNDLKGVSQAADVETPQACGQRWADSDDDADGK